MPLLSAVDLSLSYGARRIFDGASLAVEPGDRLGLVGPNGTGKSTLLELLAEKKAPDGGKIMRARGCRVGYLPQEIGGDAKDGGARLLDAVLETAPNKAALEAQLTDVEASLEGAEEEEEQMALAEELATLHEQLADLEQTFGPHQAERILAGLGFLETDFARPLGEFSGGWRMRAHLAALLYQRPDVLLLDEPTNHLDMPSVSWLSDFITAFRHAIVLTCHDKEFLNRHIKRVASLEVEGLRTFRGNYDEYLEQRKLDLEHLEARIRQSENRKKELDSFVERFRAKASKARQAQSKVKMIEKLEARAEEIPRPRQSISIRFPPTPKSGGTALKTVALEHGFGDHSLFRDVAVSVRRGDRIAIVGKNGAGKTTLLRLLAGEMEPRRGKIELGNDVSLSYFAQHHADALDPERSVLEEVWARAPEKSQTEVRSLCGAFLFSGDDVDKPIGVLSGGEKTRVALARILIDPGNVLLMDEPTNHLDTESAEKLTDSLGTYDGTLIFVSHNLDFARRLSTLVWLVEDGVHTFPGSLGDYLEELERRRAEKENAPKTEKVVPKDKAARIAARQAAAEEQKARRKRERQVKEAEAKVEALEQEIEELETLLGDPATHDDAERSAKLAKTYETKKAALEVEIERWSALSEDLTAKSS